MSADQEQSRFLSRKFIVSMLIQLVASIALFWTKEQTAADGAVTLIRVLAGGEYMQISMANITAYSLGNVGEYFATMRKAEAEARKLEAQNGHQVQATG